MEAPTPEGYERYIKGVYYQDSDLRGILTPGMEGTLDALRKVYPDGWSAKKLAKGYKLNETSTSINCKDLDKAKIVKIKEVERPQN